MATSNGHLQVARKGKNVNRTRIPPQGYLSFNVFCSLFFCFDFHPKKKNSPPFLGGPPPRGGGLS